MFTGSPLCATKPTIPVPQGIRISSFFSISCRVDLEQTSNNFDTRYLPLLFDIHLLHFLLFSLFFVQHISWELRSPWTRKREPRSAWSSMLTFWRILWHNERTSSSLQMSFTLNIKKRNQINENNNEQWIGRGDGMHIN